MPTGNDSNPQKSRKPLRKMIPCHLAVSKRSTSRHKNTECKAELRCHSSQRLRLKSRLNDSLLSLILISSSTVTPIWRPLDSTKTGSLSTNNRLQVTSIEKNRSQSNRCRNLNSSSRIKMMTRRLIAPSLPLIPWQPPISILSKHRPLGMVKRLNLKGSALENRQYLTKSKNPKSVPCSTMTPQSWP